MVDIQPREVALGLIFEYPNPMERKTLISHLEDQDFTPTDRNEEAGVFLGKDGPQIGEAENIDAQIAKKDGVIVLYNPDGNIVEIGDCAYITLRSESGDFDTVFDEIEDILTIVKKEDIKSQLLVYELTLEGSIRVSQDHAIDEYYSMDSMEKITDISNAKPSANVAMFTSDIDGESDNWYRLILDSLSSRNPRLWRLKYNRRHTDYEELTQQPSEKLITDIVEIANPED